MFSVISSAAIGDDLCKILSQYNNIADIYILS